MTPYHYDILIVGAGIAGSALAHALSTITSCSRGSQLKICLLERSLAEPDRIVGELLQPGGYKALKILGLRDCLEGIDAVPTYGYCVIESGDIVPIPYPDGEEGRSFHHGRFIQALRGKAKQAAGVVVVEASATELIECEYTKRVIGVQAIRKGEDKEAFYADLVVIADGCFSNFRSAVLGASAPKSITKSHFVGAILKDARLPMPKHGTVALTKGFGPVLMYQISEHDTRILIDVRAPLPSDLKGHILQNILPQLPSAIHLPLLSALEKDRLRRMPNSFLPPFEQGTPRTKEGVILLGDAWNMRHPLTGGGMTVALNDVVILSQMLGRVKNLGDWDEVGGVLHSWHWERKPLSSTINILSVALYDLFGAEDANLAVLRRGCFKYFELGGDCVSGPVSLLAGIAPSPLLLANHFFSVAFYSIWCMFTHPQPVFPDGPSGKIRFETARIDQYPFLFIKSIRVFWTACIVFGPLLWSEMRW